ncbi:fimbrial protein [Escherichia albertii]|uniref:fimbrial protein n=1 Tax=Escherichia albertii TaxID=208962 RepID=UPI000C9ECB4B|nr:fimbrial protein [Escherichia albertii]AUS64272.1 fimbrial protein [Escherichia albertii]EAB1452653.1 fimbrial protein [Escherichia albertii]EEW7341125.1 fimbrial protein [Escherichia albertii]EJY9799349.1 fimbrial protein [Escherichia albertii]MCU7326575.1 fimbrial protein [Escherichia albertii]
MKRILMTIPLLGFCLPQAVQATNIDVDFIATVTETTCTMKIVKDTVDITDNGGDQYSLTIPDVGLDKLVNLDASAETSFKLVASGCSAGIGTITTRISGTAISGNLIKNEATATPIANNIGMGIKRKSTTGETYLKPDSTTSFNWTAAEISGGLPMTVALRETTAGQGQIGNFRAKATFSFTYQ